MRIADKEKFIKRLVAPVTVVALGAVGVSMLEHGHSSDNAEQAKAAMSVKNAENTYVMLEEGANVRTTPQTVQDGTSGDTNLAFQIPSGKRVLVKIPLASANEKGWIGFDNPETKTHKPEDTVWANLEALEDQGLAHVVSVGKDDGDPVPVTIKHGHFVTDFQTGILAGQSEMAPKENFEGEYNYMLRDGDIRPL